MRGVPPKQTAILAFGLHLSGPGAVHAVGESAVPLVVPLAWSIIHVAACLLACSARVVARPSEDCVGYVTYTDSPPVVPRTIFVSPLSTVIVRETFALRSVSTDDVFPRVGQAVDVS